MPASTLAGEPNASVEGPSIAIIGAGAGGLAFGIALRRKLGYENFTIYEKASEVGGTWRDNVYPGCASDVAVAFYSLSSDLHDWKTSHGFQPEIQEYWVGLSHKYQLTPHIVFNSKIVGANWNEEDAVWELLIEDVMNREETKTESQISRQRTVTANIVISAIGILEVPRFARIPGIDTFKGTMFHSARWDTRMDLRGKRVAVVGNAASAVQFVPIITEDPTVEVTEFCRTPNWMLPPVRTHYSEFRRWIFRKLPFLARLLRWMGFLRVLKLYIISAAPKEYHKDLIPTYPLGCKRIIFNTNYLSALHRANLNLNWDGIESIVEEGIITKKGDKIPFDVLIFATGYAADVYPIPVKGKKSKTIQEYFAEKSGPTAYLGTAMPGFPNFFTIFGPNTATGHTSVVYSNEIQTDYTLQLIKPILERQVVSIEVKAEANDAYNAKIQARLSKSVFTHCLSWYLVDGQGKNVSIFPGSGTLFWWWLRNPKWEDYTGIGLEQWVGQIQRQRTKQQVPLIVFLIFLGIFLGITSRKF